MAAVAAAVVVAPAPPAAAAAATVVAAGREKAEGGGDVPSPPLPSPPRGQRADVFDERTRKELFTDTYCKVCGAILQFESQRIAHYEGKRHAQKVRLYLQMYNEQMDRLHMNFQENPNMDKNMYCKLCNMVFTSPVVAQSHYLGKIHAKKLKQLSDQTQPIQDVQSEHALGVGNYVCTTCNISLTSIEMYQSHMQGNKHQLKENMIATSLMKISSNTNSSFQDELADYIQVQKARGLEPNVNFRKPEQKTCEAINGHEETFASDQGFLSRNAYEPNQHSTFFPEMDTFSYSVGSRSPYPPMQKYPVKLENVCTYSTNSDSEKQVPQLTIYRNDSYKPLSAESTDRYKSLFSKNSSSADKGSHKLPKKSRAKKERPQEGEGDRSTLKRAGDNQETELEKDGKKKKKKNHIDSIAGSKSKHSKVKGSKDHSSEKKSKRHKKERKKYETSATTEEDMLWNESVLGF
ncbi:lysine-rich coiled-coil protein 1 isoform X2 [Ahaetulla prasina]|uniref:lysine-rich coiled-coil protein 1 isoform X2 n=1 Tax=Ahaetulla prasina TaxID=499056 RepID=UPI002647F946|nr:lysine-rich coiled-coil protein 1 isoform X2 [Ahaetulla prasina]